MNILLEAIHELNKLELEEEFQYISASKIDLSEAEFIDIPNYKNIPGCDPYACIIDYNGKRTRITSRLIVLNNQNDV